MLPVKGPEGPSVPSTVDETASGGITIEPSLERSIPVSEHKTPSDASQGPKALHNLTEALFGPYIGQCWVTAAAAGDEQSWAGGFYKPDRVAAFDPARGHYFSIALMKPGSTARTNANFAGGRLIVADDVGYVAPNGAIPMSPGAEVDVELFDLFAPETCWEVETSPGNYQKGYVIDPPEPDLDRWSRFLGLMKQHPRFAAAFRKTTPIHYMRQETGSNQPKAGRPRFRTRLAKPFTGKTYTLDELAAAFGIDLSVQPPSKKASASAETCSPETLAAILDAIPNTEKAFPRGEWTGVAHAIVNTLGETDEARDIWLKWSNTYNGTIRPGEAERVWDTLPPDHTNDLGSLRKILLNLHGEDSDTFVTLQRRIANDQAPLTAIDDADLPQPAAETAKQEREIDRLIREIAKTRKVPQRHRGNHDGNWLGQDDTLQGLSRALAAPIVNTPMVIHPHARGALTTLAGPPASGKSLLLLHQMLGVVYDEPKLVRGGTERVRHAGDIVYVSNEDGLNVVRKRAKAILQRFCPGKAPVHELYPVRSQLLSNDGGKVRYECIRVLKAILKLAETGRDIAMIAVDTLPSSIGNVEENSAKEMGLVLNLLSRFAEAFWVSVVFIHHGTKAGWNPEDDTLASGLRGSGAIGGTVRGVDILNSPTKKEMEAFGWAGRDIRRELVAKASDGVSGKVVGYYEFDLEPVDVENSETGVVEQVEMPVLEWVGLHPTVVAGSGVSGAMDPVCRHALAAIRDAEAQGREMRLPRRPTNIGDTSVTKVLDNLPVKKAMEVVRVLADAGQLVLEETKDAKGNPVVLVRVGKVDLGVDEGPF